MKAHELAMLLLSRPNNEIAATVDVSVSEDTAGDRVFGLDCNEVFEAGNKVFIVFESYTDNRA